MRKSFLEQNLQNPFTNVTLELISTALTNISLFLLGGSFFYPKNNKTSLILLLIGSTLTVINILCMFFLPKLLLKSNSEKKLKQDRICKCVEIMDVFGNIAEKVPPPVGCELHGKHLDNTESTDEN